MTLSATSSSTSSIPDKLIEGSPKNSTSSVPIMPWRTRAAAEVSGVTGWGEAYEDPEALMVPSGWLAAFFIASLDGNLGI